MRSDCLLRYTSNLWRLQPLVGTALNKTCILFKPNMAVKCWYVIASICHIYVERLTGKCVSHILRRYIYSLIYRGKLKAIEWRSVSCKVTCYHIPGEKTLQIIGLYFVPTLQSAVYILYTICIVHSAFCTNRYSWHQYSKLAQHPTLCIQFLNRENNDKNNTFPLGKQICFTIVRDCAET